MEEIKTTITVFRKVRTTKDGRKFDAFFGKFENNIGEDRTISIKFAKDSYKSLGNAEYPLQLQLSSQDYFVTYKKDKNGNLVLTRTGERIRELVITSLEHSANLGKAPDLPKITLADL